MARTGRPSRITDVLTRGDGTTIPLVEQLVADIRVHGFTEEAASRAGIDRRTVYDWLRTGATAGSKMLKDPTYRPTAQERRCLDFSHAVDRARAEALTEGMGLMLRMGRGTSRTIVTTKADDKGIVTETTTRVEDVPPDVRALIWTLERRFPEQLHPATRVELSGPGGDPIELSAESPAERLARIMDDMGERAAESAALLAEADTPDEQKAIEAGE